VDKLKPEGHGFSFSRTIKAARKARFRSADGTSEGAAEATGLTFPPAAACRATSQIPASGRATNAILN
jgi:hypothetical protein